ncbi:MAG: diguanylate cyclase [Treponema sp.]|nr:diguanylate cyclase [Treponema sp.]
MKGRERNYRANLSGLDDYNVEHLQLENYIQLLLNNIPNVLFLVDKDFRIAYCSAQFLELVNVESFYEIKGKSLLDVYHLFMDEELIKKEEERIQIATRTKKTVISEVPIIWASGKLCLYAIQTSPLIDESGAVDGLCAIFQDVTDIMNAKRKAEEANRAKTNFLVKMSREIRASMNTVASMSAFMRTDNLDDVQERYFNDIKKIAQSLLIFINDILDFSKMEAGKMELLPCHFNIATLFDNIVSLFHFIIIGKGLNLKAVLADDVPTILFGDETRIRQIIANILNNAVRYTRQGGIELSIFVENNELGIRISDTGIGIKKEDIPTIFDNFEKFDHKANRGVDGIGLKLAVTKQLVNLLHGSIKVESVYGRGSTFTVFLPLEAGDIDKVELQTKNLPYIAAKNRDEMLAKLLLSDKITVSENGQQSGDLSQDRFDKLRHIRGLDIENGVSYTGDSIDNYLKVLRQFCQDFDGRKAAILSLLKQKDWKNYIINIHTFKGITAIIGMQQLSEKAKKLEAKAMEIINDEPTAQAAERICKTETQALLSSLNAFKEKLEPILGESSPSNKNPISAFVLIETLKALQKACEAYKVNQAAEIAMKLAVATHSESVDKALNNIGALVSSLDYEKATTEIEQLLKELAENTPLPKSRILIVDDDKTNHLILNSILTLEYEPVFAFTGKEAFMFIEREKPDIILLDIMLPEINGFDILKKLKSKPETASIPVIIITALNNFKYEEEGLALGAVDFITKPFRPVIIKARLKTQFLILQHLRTLEKAGLVDELTGIPNRRCFNDRIAIEWKRAERDQKFLSFCMIDVDKFKEYNDAYGHLQGDVLLQAIANVFATSARRASDITARLGGEEFGILLSDTSLRAAVEIAEQIRRHVQELKICTAEGELTSITISIGVASIMPNANLSYHDLMRQADSFLYTAKNTGRNRICSPLGNSPL